MQATADAKELAAVLGHADDPYSIEVNDGLRAKRKIAIEPLSLDQISRIMLLLDRLADKGIRLDELNRKNFSNLTMVLKGGDDFRELLATASNQEPEAIGKLNFVDVARVAGKVWTVNKDFFGENQLEVLKAFGLEEKDLDGLKSMFHSIRSLLNSTPPASQTSDDSPSDNLSESSTSSSETSEPNSND